jgi:hypothetical protein
MRTRIRETSANAANPACTTDPDLPPPPSIGELCDPAEPHPDEPGVPADAPARRSLPAQSIPEIPRNGQSLPADR